MNNFWSTWTEGSEKSFVYVPENGRTAGAEVRPNSSQHSRNLPNNLDTGTLNGFAGAGQSAYARNSKVLNAAMEIDTNDYDFESLSTSPNSVKTPDFDMLDDLVDFQEEQPQALQTGGFPMQSSQNHRGWTEASEHTPMPNYVYQNISTTIAVPLQGQIDPRGWHKQAMPVNISHSISRQTYNNACANAYTEQPSTQDPWSAEGNPRSPYEPQADSVIFAPDWAFHQSMNTWTVPLAAIEMPMSTTVSSTQHGETLYGSPSGLAEAQTSFQSSPVEHFNFRDGTDTFSVAHKTEIQTISSPYAASATTLEDLSPVQEPVHPFLGVQDPFSPGSDWSLSRQASECGATLEFIQEHETKPILKSPSPSQSSRSMSKATPKIPSDSSATSRSGSRKQKTSHNRPGGRILGSHLPPEVAAEASSMRKISACWHCVLQRDKCGPGDICERCVKRAQRPNTGDYGLGCNRTHLKDLTEYFVPELMTSIHDDAVLTEFVAKHIDQWYGRELSIRLTCGKKLPFITCKVYEFAPKTSELLRQWQYVTNTDTGICTRKEIRSPPIGLTQVTPGDQRKYDEYVNKIVQHHLPQFGEMLFSDEKDDFQLRLFQKMIAFQPSQEDEIKLMKEVNRLLVATYIMGRSITIEESSREHILSKLHSYQPGLYAAKCCPRMAQRQLKYFFSRLQSNIMRDALNKLQQVLKSSKGMDKWTTAFCAVLGLAMAHEDNQKTIHYCMDTKAAQGLILPHNAEREGDEACRAIDDRFAFVLAIFKWKYNRSYNPLRDAENSEMEWGVKLKDERAVRFIRDVSALVTEKSDYLQERQHIGIASYNGPKYTSRLVARFLLSFWNPTSMC